MERLFISKRTIPSLLPLSAALVVALVILANIHGGDVRRLSDLQRFYQWLLAISFFTVPVGTYLFVKQLEMLIAKHLASR